MSVLIEVSVDSVASALAAQGGGAGRIELCADVLEGGTTPSAGMIAVVREHVGIPLFVLIRPRSGDFVYDATELAVMRRDIATARDLGANGIVIGALQPDGTVDADVTSTLVEAARPLEVTFHRAFDFTRDAFEALDAVVGLGIDRVLTSGCAATALEGIATLAELVRRAGARPGIVAAGDVTEDNAGRIVRVTGVREVHVRAAARRDSVMTYRRAKLSLAKPPLGEYTRLETDSRHMERLVDALGEEEEP
jgi:copper homeostasis protein